MAKKGLTELQRESYPGGGEVRGNDGLPACANCGPKAWSANLRRLLTRWQFL